MATKIRLKRIGRRNRPFYRVVVMDSRNKRDGAAIEELGWFNPIDSNKPYSLDEDRIVHWLKTGAQPSDALHSLMKRSGLAHRWHLIQQGLDEKDIEKSKLQDLLKIAEEESNKTDISDQSKYLADQKVETLKSLN